MNAQHSRVMFVDDEEGVRLSWSRYLSARGFDVTTVEDGERAVSRLATEPVDVVVADLRMPGLDGLQLLEWMHGNQPETQFILFTGFGNEEIERKARALGAFDYLNKPMSPEAVSAVITAALLVEKNQAARAEVRAETQIAAEPALVGGPVKAKRTAKEWAKIGLGLATAPLLGLAFVMFLPVIGFGMLFWAVAKRLRKQAAASVIA